MENDKYIAALRQDIEDKFNRTFRSATDFDRLELLVKNNSDGTLNASTLKRIWGYSKTTSRPLRSTLTVLANVLGFRDWESYVEKKKGERKVESGFISHAALDITDLKDGDLVSFKWNPGRTATLVSRGRGGFEVLEQENSSLRVGDRFRIQLLREGYPLYCEDVIRGKENLGDYIAGEQTGIRDLCLCPMQCGGFGRIRSRFTAE